MNEEIGYACSPGAFTIEDLFTIDHFGGWKDATPTFFGDTGVFYEVLAKVQGIEVSE